MNETEQIDNWYALFVVTGEEDKVKERLNYKFSDRFRFLVPKRRLRERKDGKWFFNTRVLFPGYVLVNGYIDIDDYYDLKNVPGLIRLLRSGTDILRIDRNEIYLISKLMCNGEIIEFSTALVENGKVVVVDGPLVSMEGIIVGIDHRKGRAKVRMSFLGEERTVDLGISVLRPA